MIFKETDIPIPFPLYKDIKRPKWEQKLPKIQAFVLLFFFNLEPLENGEKIPRNRPKWEQKMTKSRHSKVVTHFSITQA